MIKNLKERAIGVSGSASGLASIAGSWQICHNICLGLIAVLGAVGITVAGMPLLFLTKIAVPLWTAALALLLVTIAVYAKKRCISNKLIIFNSGLIIAGMPFAYMQRFSPFFWAAGGLVAFTGAALFIKDKLQGRKHVHG